MGFLVVRGRYQRNQWDFSLLRSMDITKESNGIFLCYSPCTVAGETIVTLHQLFQKCYNWFLFLLHRKPRCLNIHCRWFRQCSTSIRDYYQWRVHIIDKLLENKSNQLSLVWLMRVSIKKIRAEKNFWSRLQFRECSNWVVARIIELIASV